MSQDTVIGQGTAPDPEDETYLSLLKGTAKKSGIRVKIKKENAGLMTPHSQGESPPDPSRETAANLLKNTIKVKKIEIEDDNYPDSDE